MDHELPIRNITPTILIISDKECQSTVRLFLCQTLFWLNISKVKHHPTFSTDIGLDWHPPPDFTSDIVPIVFRNMDDEERLTLHNGAKLDFGKVLILFLRNICRL